MQTFIKSIFQIDFSGNLTNNRSSRFSFAPTLQRGSTCTKTLHQGLRWRRERRLMFLSTKCCLWTGGSISVRGGTHRRLKRNKGGKQRGSAAPLRTHALMFPPRLSRRTSVCRFPLNGTSALNWPPNAACSVCATSAEKQKSLRQLQSE